MSWAYRSGILFCQLVMVACAGGGGGGAPPPPPPAPDFSLAVAPNPLTIQAGQTGSVTVNATRSNGHSDPISLSLSGAPGGITGSAVLGGTSVGLPIAVAASVPAQTYAFNVLGTSGSLVHSALLNLTVSPTASPDFSLSLSPPTLSIGRGGSQSTQVSLIRSGGFNAAVAITATGLPAGVAAAPLTLDPSDTSGNLVLTASASAVLGTTTVTVQGLGGDVQRTAPLGLTITDTPTPGMAPFLFFTDLTNGPNTGGQDDLGVFMTIYGEGFGAQRSSSTVTIGGTEVANYVSWGQDNGIARDLDMIVIQPGLSVTSGNIVVTVNGKASNPLPFTVRSGQIYFVIPGAPNADDTNSGTYSAPFKTLYRPRQVMQAGDIVYIKGGTFSGEDPASPGWDAVLLLDPGTDPNGTADRPIAYIGYPGDRPLINAPEPLRRGIFINPGMMYYVFANLAFTQGRAPYEGMLQMSGDGHRAVGNYFYDALSSTGMGIGGNSAHYQVFGNLMRNNGQDNWEDGVGFYVQGFGTNQDIDFGWNQIRDQRGRRAIQLFGHENGDRMENIRIHDNLISSSLQLRNNILLGGSDGGTEVLGTIYVYNNIIVGSDWEGLRVNDPQGTVFIQNNVLYDNGSLGPDSHAQLYIARAGAGQVTLQNNILYAESGQTYVEFGPGVDPSAVNASHNLVYNAGPCPDWDAGCINADPAFVNLASNDFHLQASSPAINAGINTGISRDYVGISRPQGAAYDIGALEFSTDVAMWQKVYLPMVLRNFPESRSNPGKPQSVPAPSR